MSKKIKSVIEESEITEPTIEKIVSEVPLDVLEQDGIKNPIYIPDIPVQMSKGEEKILNDNKGTTEYFVERTIPIHLSEKSNAETEIEFLQRILFIQEDGGFGKHLHPIIKERIKTLS